jgi:hypothetical protein
MIRQLMNDEDESMVGILLIFWRLKTLFSKIRAQSLMAADCLCVLLGRHISDIKKPCQRPVIVWLQIDMMLNVLCFQHIHASRFHQVAD